MLTTKAWPWAELAVWPRWAPGGKGPALLLWGTHGFAFLMSPSLLLFWKLGEKKGWIQALLLSFLPLPLAPQEFMAALCCFVRSSLRSDNWRARGLAYFGFGLLMSLLVSPLPWTLMKICFWIMVPYKKREYTSCRWLGVIYARSEGRRKGHAAHVILIAPMPSFSSWHKNHPRLWRLKVGSSCSFGDFIGWFWCVLWVLYVPSFQSALRLRTAARQAPLSTGFSRQEYWTGLPRLSPGDLPHPGNEPVSLACPALQADSSPLSDLGS